MMYYYSPLSYCWTIVLPDILLLKYVLKFSIHIDYISVLFFAVGANGKRMFDFLLASLKENRSKMGADPNKKNFLL